MEQHTDGDRTAIEVICPHGHYGDKTAMSTTRHKFVKRLPKETAEDRQKWLVYDTLAGHSAILHKVASNYENGTINSPAMSLVKSTSSFGKNGNFHNERYSLYEAEESKRDFFREVILMKCVRKCPHILKCHGFVVDSTRNLYIATEHFGEETLESFQSRAPGKVLPDELAKHICGQIFKALTYLHSTQIVHNNIQASSVSVMCEEIDNSWSSIAVGRVHAKLGNFYSARDSLTWINNKNEFDCYKCRPSAKVGDLQFIPDTTFRATRSDPMQDMLSLGHLIFRCLRGCTPWERACHCDSYYSKHCRRLERIRKNICLGQPQSDYAGEDQAAILSKRLWSASQIEEARGVARSLQNNESKNKRVPLSKPIERQEKAVERSWKPFSEKFGSNLALILSPSRTDCMNVTNLIRCTNSSENIFTKVEDGGMRWSKKRFGRNVFTNCVVPQLN